MSDVLDRFHPAIRGWFEERFPEGPTAPQREAWPHIAAGSDVLVASPTGTGKTLTGFLVAIDEAYRALPDPEAAATGSPRVLYISPLRALAVDVHANLIEPLEEIRRRAVAAGHPPVDLRVGIRTGDTPAAERRALTTRPPDLLVTTPESLYLLLTAPSSRALLANVRTVIVDEVHTLARDKRGAHLALSLERLAQVVADGGGRLQRIGLSATVRPLDTMARLLCGADPARPAPVIVDCGHRRDLDVEIELPAAELEAVSSNEQFADILGRIAGHVRRHRTTLIFVNTRKMAERVAHLLAARLEDPTGDLQVAAHHGSLSADRRRLVETRLRGGQLRALVATASLELGIDVGPVELVCQIGSPRAIGTFLQRVGRANHQLDGVPAGRLYPMTRDELVECTALLAGVRAGRLDALEPPDAPLDVLAQQLVAEVAAAGEWGEDELFDLIRSAAPYEHLGRGVFDDVVELVSSGIMTGRGRRGAYLHRDGVNHRLRARAGARLTALTCGGAIPETGEYRVVLDPENVTVGSVHEDFAVEANIGDVFLLGTHSWRVRQVQIGTVRVSDAGGAPPTVPFWLGEAPARTAALSAEVSMLRAALEEPLRRGDLEEARQLVAELAGVSTAVAGQVVDYLAEGLAALGRLPTTETLVIERFFDESEGTQLVVHSPYGGRVNRALGLALRKRFCVSFDFELQAAADDDTVVLSLGPQHSFPLAAVPTMLRSATVIDVLTQAVLPHPMLAARWRWNCNRALVVPRSRSGSRRPIHLQRMDADDLLAATWPSLAACQENAPAGPIPVPDHVLVRQTVTDCLTEALDAEGLRALWERVEHGEVGVQLVESAEPSVFARGILNGRPYTFLDDAPLEERRSRAVPGERRTRRAANRDRLPVPIDQLAALDPAAVTVVLEQVRPRLRNPDELHDLLLSLVRCRPVDRWQDFYAELAACGRARCEDGNWIATERIDAHRAIETDDEAAADCIRGHLELAGPIGDETLVGEIELGVGDLRGAPIGLLRARTALARLEAEGSAVALPDGRWCARHLLVRIHRAGTARQRRRVEPVGIGDFVRFLSVWHHATPDSRLIGRDGLRVVLDQLAGVEIPAGDWETKVLPARLRDYDPRLLDELCMSGEIVWARLTPRVPSRRKPAGNASRRGGVSPSPSTPLALIPRVDLDWQLAAVRRDASILEPEAGASADILAALRGAGASFRSDLGRLSGRLAEDVNAGLWDLVARGLVTADSYAAVRAVLASAKTRRRERRPRWRTRPAFGGSLTAGGSLGSGEGRWALLQPLGDTPAATPDDHSTARTDDEELAEVVAGQLLARNGVIVWELWDRESYRLPWREVIRAVRRFEARGQVLGGRFVDGLSGEQYALPEAAEVLRHVADTPSEGADLLIAGSDPLNVTGTVLPGTRVPATRTREVRLRDGVAHAQRTWHAELT